MFIKNLWLLGTALGGGEKKKTWTSWTSSALHRTSDTSERYKQVIAQVKSCMMEVQGNVQEDPTQDFFFKGGDPLNT